MKITILLPLLLLFGCTVEVHAPELQMPQPPREQTPAPCVLDQPKPRPTHDITYGKCPGFAACLTRHDMLKFTHDVKAVSDYDAYLDQFYRDDAAKNCQER